MVRASDLSSDAMGRETVVPAIKKPQPVREGREFDLPFQICPRGSHFYVASSSALATIGLRNPAPAVVARKLIFQSQVLSYTVFSAR